MTHSLNCLEGTNQQPSTNPPQCPNAQYAHHHLQILELEVVAEHYGGRVPCVVLARNAEVCAVHFKHTICQSTPRDVLHVVAFDQGDKKMTKHRWQERAHSFCAGAVSGPADLANTNGKI